MRIESITWFLVWRSMESRAGRSLLGQSPTRVWIRSSIFAGEKPREYHVSTCSLRTAALGSSFSKAEQILHFLPRVSLGGGYSRALLAARVRLSMGVTFDTSALLRDLLRRVLAAHVIGAFTFRFRDDATRGPGRARSGRWDIFHCHHPPRIGGLQLDIGGNGDDFPGVERAPDLSVKQEVARKRPLSWSPSPRRLADGRRQNSAHPLLGARGPPSF